jgi:hypothetical protein
MERTGDHVMREMPGPSHQRWLSLPSKERRAIVQREVINSLSQ